jgi:hypothetical protein
MALSLTTLPRPQRTGDVKVKRSDHVWFSRKDGFLCVLCGALCSKPPAFPTPAEWMPDRYEALTKEERALCPPRRAS